MRYFVFVDRFDLLPVITGFINNGDEMVLINIGQLKCAGEIRVPGRIMEWDEISLEEVDSLDITGHDKVIISTIDGARFSSLIEKLSSEKIPPPILVFTEGGSFFPGVDHSNVAVVDLADIVKHQLNNEWKLIETRRKAFELLAILSTAEKVLILTQNDPDPDAIACGLAVQALLGRNRTTAPICTFGEVTRNENLAMIAHLRTTVRTIDKKDLSRFDKVVMVDTQPPYFPDGLFDKVDVVIDHHPHKSDYEVTLKDVNITYGATSTMLYEYLISTDTKINRRLATALLYGIITDTMYLARDTSKRDFEAFSALWPMANSNMLASMSRPRLDPEELSYFMRAIKNRKVAGSFVFIWLGTVKREDIIPRLADFSLQIGEAVWSAVCGKYEDEVVISIRNMGLTSDAGEVARTLFGKFGSAGGHRSMAKAVLPLKGLKSGLKIKNMKQIGERLFDMLNNELADEL
ncbi:Kef-type K+ transport systems (NAD-binding component fused to domain related to exopolyphosphatase) [hydrothermal vent metagenome]|uniref:Kef-type K+ transport systems (NAD-binding component fused to domain related to exopolyphosphatase) n=1 Tax=hydrothermal vent metagenome TaxID=652676 RepID=A0A3B1C7R9_9ZZZZ